MASFERMGLLQLPPLWQEEDRRNLVVGRFDLLGT